jgi:two-component system response regulator ChvI
MTEPDDKAPSGTRVVLVDDDAAFLGVLRDNLEQSNFEVAALNSGKAALEWFQSDGNAATMLLDWELADMDGPSLLRQLRDAGHQIPVIFLTGHGESVYEETALALGAIDFVDKSRGFSIILGRLKLALRRAGLKTVDGEGQEDGVFKHGDLSLDLASARAHWKTLAVPLTHTEFKVVRHLAMGAGRDASYREIYDLMRGEGFKAGQGEDGYRTNVRAIVKRVRQKFRDIDPEFEALENYSGFGYRWRDERGP